MQLSLSQWFSLPQAKSRKTFDWGLVILPLVLMSIGLVMVASASMDFAAQTYGDPWFFAKRHGVFMVLALAIGVLVFSMPTEWWNRYAVVILLAGIALLVAVLIPGVGKAVNGAQRWISIAGFTVQASEVAKFTFIVFFASFLSRRSEEFKTEWSAFFKLLGIWAVFIALLLLEPDFGSGVVLCLIAGAMMFVAGVPVIRFVLLALVGVVGLGLLAVLEPYRWQRLITFLDPWEKQFSSGYQLVQSLIAFGRGEWFGMGLGNSLQKLFFLPEAHTDFIFAIIAEEFGFVGAMTVLGIFALLVARILKLAMAARQAKRLFIVYAATGVAVMMAGQAFINMGVASGLLPTKGLTLPFISVGGSSLIVCCALMALIQRMDWELKA